MSATGPRKRIASSTAPRTVLPVQVKVRVRVSVRVRVRVRVGSLEATPPCFLQVRVSG